MSLKGNWSYPTQILFGEGYIRNIVATCHGLGMQRPLLVTDKGLADMEITRKTRTLLEEGGMDGAIFSEVDSNPSDINVDAGVQFYRDGGYDGVIAFGGGSGIDLGKTLAFMVGQTRPIWDFEDIDDWWKRADADAIHPIIAVPTTAGTGSEVGRAAIITNTQTHEKKIIFHPKMLPSIVICDPELTVGMPQSITAGTGLDAFAHCVEAFCSPHYHPMSHGIALEGMRIVKTYLYRAYENPLDMEARSNMMTAALMGAVAFQKGLGAIHALSHPIGALYHTHHGTTNALFMPFVLEFNRPAIEESIESAMRYLDIEGGFNGFYDFVLQFNRSMGIPADLRGLGIETPDLEFLTRSALNDPSCAGNPIPMTYDNIYALYEKAR